MIIDDLDPVDSERARAAFEVYDRWITERNKQPRETISIPAPDLSGWKGARVVFSEGMLAGESRKVRPWHRSWWSHALLISKWDEATQTITYAQLRWWRNFRWWRLKWSKS